MTHGKGLMRLERVQAKDSQNAPDHEKEKLKASQGISRLQSGFSLDPEHLRMIHRLDPEPAAFERF